MQSQNYAGTLLSTDAGPPYRSAYDHATLRVSAGTDGGNLVTINPWLAIYFMTTGLNDAGNMRVPPGETISVTEAIELYTSAASWFSFDETKLGSLEVSKFADLAVLSDDVLALETQGRLADLRDVTSVITIVNGDIVYSDGTLVECADSNAFHEWYRLTGDSVCVLGTCNGDIDGDGAVGIVDFLALLAAWGPCPGCPEDLDDDGAVGIIDFLALLAAWGPCP